ncbi:MAG: hydroxymethylglutaryl-CoA lyase [Candidatus Dormibacterales bacterium]
MLEREMLLTICDVAPRDGLQNEAVTLAPAVRAELCRRLAAAGLPKVEAASFVNPKQVPQMAGAEEVMADLAEAHGVVYAGLVLNERGYERALAAGVGEVHYSFGVTDTFTRRNQRASTAESISASHRIVARARRDGLPVTVTLSVAFGCPFEGRVEAARVLEVVERVLEEAPDEVVLADTIGVGVPRQVRELVAGARSLGAAVGCHFHDTRNTAVANALAALESGAVSLDASAGGTGGCPFAPRATGNVATEDLVYMLQGMGVETGVDLEALIACAGWLGERLGRELPGRVSRAGGFSAVTG